MKKELLELDGKGRDKRSERRRQKEKHHRSEEDSVEEFVLGLEEEEKFYRAS
jgi:hypothetical protein